MKNPLGAGNGMVPHYSGTTLDAQARYANGTKSILENYLSGKPQEPQNVIVGVKGYESKACMCLSPTSCESYLTVNPLRNRRPALIPLVKHLFETTCFIMVILYVLISPQNQITFFHHN